MHDGDAQCAFALAAGFFATDFLAIGFFLAIGCFFAMGDVGVGPFVTAGAGSCVSVVVGGGAGSVAGGVVGTVVGGVASGAVAVAGIGAVEGDAAREGAGALRVCGQRTSMIASTIAPPTAAPSKPSRIRRRFDAAPRTPTTSVAAGIAAT